MSHAFHADETFDPGSRADWRRWLADNHATSTGVWLAVYRKDTGQAGVPYEDAVEEALCFGWIDGKSQKLDGQRFRQWFAPRKRGSTWAQSNKLRVEKLIALGLMTPAVMALVEAARADGSWTMLDDSEALIVPPDLQAALDAVPGAAAGFAGLSKSLRKGILFWISSAKRPETRQKRLEQTVAAAAQKRSPVGPPPAGAPR